MKLFFSTNTRRSFLLFALATLCFSATFFSNAQSDSLQFRFDEMMSKGETYQQFKVIRNEKLINLMREVQDTIQNYQAVSSDLQQQIDDQTLEINSLTTELKSIELQLAETQSKLGKLDFIGIPFNVGTYHLIVWVLIFLFAGLSLFVYTMFLRANIVTKTVSGEHESLLKEFEAFKERCREKEVKIKRELQTTLNALEELKRGSKK